MAQFLLVVHIAVLGYWLGAELVINSTYRFVSRSPNMPMPERNRLMDHVMNVDQHVRYALLLQLVSGVMLAVLYGFLPGGKPTLITAGLVGAAWLALVEITHRRRKTGSGQGLARFDRMLRYALMLGLVILAVWVLSGGMAGVVAMPPWLAWKLLCFASVMACGVGIRLCLIHLEPSWAEMNREGSNPEREARVWSIYKRATAVLLLLWIFIGAAVCLSIAKPI